ncbi:MAG: U32 family peptidase [Oscillospiraceae bacterium]|nr:U32 family peptidase [Oscillospiraceae bacterium]
MPNKNKIELLSPAGDMESVKAGFLYGANSVYVGGERFGLRANAGFCADELAEAVKYARNAGKRIYLTCNIVANNSDIDMLPEFIVQAEKIGVDAVIVSDLGVLDLVKSNSTLSIHVSTQAGVMNYASANMLYKLGAKRIILARETPLSEIKRIRDETPPELEIEAFVHGAMCMGFSGRCLISSYLTGRDANRGQCAQPCRWGYYLTEETRPNEFFKVFEDERGSYILNSKDLCMIEHIAELAQSGVTSFKIEGRAKTAYYSAIITNAYRAAIDAYEQGVPLPDWVKREVNCVSHRPYCTGFYFPENSEKAEDIQSYEHSVYIRDCDFVAVVADSVLRGDTSIEIIQRNYFTADDCLEIIAPGQPPKRLTVSNMVNSKGETITIANHAVETICIECDGNAGAFPKGSFIRKVRGCS